MRAQRLVPVRNNSPQLNGDPSYFWARQQSGAGQQNRAQWLVSFHKARAEAALIATTKLHFGDPGMFKMSLKQLIKLQWASLKYWWETWKKRHGRGELAIKAIEDFSSRVDIRRCEMPGHRHGGNAYYTLVTRHNQQRYGGCKPLYRQVD